jgi:SAM-dependent methyltransferase
LLLPAGAVGTGQVGDGRGAVDDERMVADAARWNHNIQYHELILAAVPADAERVVDVGCGEGLLTRQLRRRLPHVVGIDADPASIELARQQDPHARIGYQLGDFLTHPFPPESFDVVTCVAALHHMPPAAALTTMARLLRPGGVLIVVGCARSRLPADLCWEIAAVLTHRLLRLTKTEWHQPAPTRWPPPHTYAQIRRLAQRLLPGTRYRRHLLWRYSLTWIKPPATSAPDRPNPLRRQSDHQ